MLGSFAQQKGGQLGVAACLGQVQGCFAGVIRGVEIRARPQYGIGGRLVTVRGGQMQRGATVFVFRCQGDSLGNKRLNGRDLAVFRGVQEALGVGLLRKT